MNIHDQIQERIKENLFVARVFRVNRVPVGPHPIASFQTWVPCESLHQVLSFFMINRPPSISVLLHPLTKQEIIDHSLRAMWLGAPLPLNLAALSDELDELPIEHAHLGLGYSRSLQ